MALIVASAVLVTACGGGSSTPAAAPAPAGGVVGAPTASIPGGTLNGIPQTEATSGQVGACSSIKGGAPGFEIGLCSTSFSNSFASGSVVEGVFQNGPTSSAESAANVYDLSLPSAWGGPTITLKITAGDSTNVLGGGAIGNLVI